MSTRAPRKPKISTKGNHSLSEAELCRANGWKPGTLIVGDEGYGPSVIRITAVGERKILASCLSHAGKPCERREGAWVLWCRDWRRVSVAVAAQFGASA